MNQNKFMLQPISGRGITLGFLAAPKAALGFTFCSDDEQVAIIEL